MIDARGIALGGIGLILSLVFWAFLPGYQPVGEMEAAGLSILAVAGPIASMAVMFQSLRLARTPAY